jgi:hypothetical protein
MIQFFLQSYHMFTGFKWVEISRWAFTIGDFIISNGDFIITQFASFLITATHFSVMPFHRRFFHKVHILYTGIKLEIWEDISPPITLP